MHGHPHFNGLKTAVLLGGLAAVLMLAGGLIGGSNGVVFAFVIALKEENCTVCMLCARECPDWCIYIDSHKETIPAPEGGRERQRNVLDRFDIDFSLCMYCGICIEVCPFDALFWSPEFEYSELDIRDLTHGKDRLGQWMATVPPPPAHDVHGVRPKELDAAHKAADKAAADKAGELES